MLEGFVDRKIKDERYDICKSCDRLMKTSKNCKECGCFMFVKTALKSSRCPIGKWEAVK